MLAQEDVTESLSSPDRILWPLPDHLQTTRDLIDHAGDLREHYEYDSFGQILSGDTSLTRFLFTAREHDPATNLNYHRARWYDPVPGRWISEDPLTFSASDENVARYVSNNPVAYVDMNGLEQQLPSFGAEYTESPEWSAAYADWHLQQIGGSLLGSNPSWIQQTIAYELATLQAMNANPISTVMGWYTGVGHGWAMIGNHVLNMSTAMAQLAAPSNPYMALPLPVLQSAQGFSNTHVTELLHTNGLAYSAANVVAWVGVNAASLAAGAVAWHLAKMPTYGTAWMKGNWYYPWGHAAYRVTAHGKHHYLNYMTNPARVTTEGAKLTFDHATLRVLDLPLPFPRAAMTIAPSSNCITTCLRAFSAGGGGLTIATGISVPSLTFPEMIETIRDTTSTPSVGTAYPISTSPVRK